MRSGDPQLKTLVLVCTSDEGLFQSWRLPAYYCPHPRELPCGLFQTTNCIYAGSTFLIWSSIRGPASQPVTQGGALISAFELRGRSGTQTSRTIILPRHAFVDMSTLCSGSRSLPRPSLCLAVRLWSKWLRKEIAANSVLHLMHWKLLLLKSLRRVND